MPGGRAGVRVSRQRRLRQEHLLCVGRRTRRELLGRADEGRNAALKLLLEERDWGNM